MFAASQDPVVTTPGTPINLELRKYVKIAIDSWERVPSKSQEAFTIDNFRNILAMLEQGVDEVSPTRQVTKTASPQKSGCFIATAAYGSAFAPEVVVFRCFRDEILLTSTLGSLFVDVYYLVSPPLASLISRADILKKATRHLALIPILRLLKVYNKG